MMVMARSRYKLHDHTLSGRYPKVEGSVKANGVQSAEAVSDIIPSAYDDYIKPSQHHLEYAPLAIQTTQSIIAQTPRPYSQPTWSYPYSPYSCFAAHPSSPPQLQPDSAPSDHPHRYEA